MIINSGTAILSLLAAAPFALAMSQVLSGWPRVATAVAQPVIDDVDIFYRRYRGDDEVDDGHRGRGRGRGSDHDSRSPSGGSLKNGGGSSKDVGHGGAAGGSSKGKSGGTNTSDDMDRFGK